MKWKITRKFLGAIITTILISLIVFFIINMIKLYSGTVDTEEFLTVKAPDITLEYGKNIEYKNGKINIDQDKLNELKTYESWIQVLDENGTEIYSKFKPNYAPTHYTPGEMIFYHKYSGSINEYTLFVGTTEIDNKKLSYVIGYPENKVSKASITFSPETLIANVLKLIISTIVVILVISTIVGYQFSLRLANPIVSIMEGIRLLSKGDYTKKYSDKGLYKDVYSNIENLSNILKSNEIERKKIEKMREEWIVNITHDLKTPLSSIRGYSEILLDPEYDLSIEDRTKYAEVILDKSNYIESLISDLKLTYHLSNSNIALNKKDENLVDILRESVIDILNHPKYEDVEVNFESINEGIKLYCDSNLIKRAFANIIYNAIVHNPKGTKIEISINKDRGIRVEISDNGKGISDEDLTKLFERYYRGTNTGEAHKGSGLGMAISKQIIEGHEGSIEVKSKLGVGTSVIILFK